MLRWMTLALFSLSLFSFAQTRMVPHVTPVDGAFTTDFIFTNGEVVEQTVQIMPFALDGSALDVFDLVLAPGETRFFTTPELFPAGSVSHFIIGNPNEAAVTVVYQDAAGENSAAHLTTSSTQAFRWRIYPGMLDDVLDGLAVVNMDDQAQAIHVRQVSFDGEELSRATPLNLEQKAKGLSLFQEFERRSDAYFEVFAEGPLALTALRFSTVGEGARFFWETAAVPLPQLVETANQPPVITGQAELGVVAGEPLELTLAQLTVVDPDNDFPADFTLQVSDGDNFSRSGSVITPDADFAGVLTVPVTVNDGLADSEVYNLMVNVTAPADPRIGRVAVLRNSPTYGISGRAVIVDERTIQLQNFNYNGSGPDVRVYLGVDNDFINGPIITGPINGTVRQNATVDLPLPDDVTLDDFNSISIWCTIFNFSFSEGIFR